VLEVAVGKFLDTSLIKADVQPRAVRLLIKGRLLQLVLPAEVRRGGALAAGSCAAAHPGF
jgi:protein TilB